MAQRVVTDGIHSISLARCSRLHMSIGWRRRMNSWRILEEEIVHIFHFISRRTPDLGGILHINAQVVDLYIDTFPILPPAMV